MLKYGNVDQRKQVYEELKRVFPSMCCVITESYVLVAKVVDIIKSKYATFLVNKLLKYCDVHVQGAIVKRLLGRIPRLMAHRVR